MGEVRNIWERNMLWIKMVSLAFGAFFFYFRQVTQPRRAIFHFTKQCEKYIYITAKIKAVFLHLFFPIYLLRSWGVSLKHQPRHDQEFRYIALSFYKYKILLLNAFD